MKQLKIILLLFPLLFSSCNNEDAWDIFKTAGEQITEERDIEPFNKLEMLDRINVILVQDTLERLTISGPKNLLPKVSTLVKNGCLIIKDTNRFNWVRSYDHEITATVHVQTLNHIYYEGIGDITSANQLVVDSLTIISQESAGDIWLNINVHYFYCYFNKSLVYMNLSGNAHRAHLQINGTGFLHCEGLLTSTCSVQNQGSGDITANCTNYFSGIIEGSGNILFTGNPNQRVFVYKGRGSGQFIEF